MLDLSALQGKSYLKCVTAHKEKCKNNILVNYFLWYILLCSEWVPTPFFSWANIIESVIGSKVNGPIKSQPKAQKKRSHFLVNHEANWTQWPNCLEKESWQQHWENHVFWVHLSSLLHIYSFNLQSYIKKIVPLEV